VVHDLLRERVRALCIPDLSQRVSSINLAVILGGGFQYTLSISPHGDLGKSILGTNWIWTLYMFFSYSQV